MFASMLSVEIFDNIWNEIYMYSEKNEVREFKMRHISSAELIDHEGQVYVVSKNINTNDIFKNCFGLKENENISQPVAAQ